MEKGKSKQRLFEEKVIKFFVSQIPEINDFVKNTFKYYDETESAGMYIVLPDIIRYLTTCVKKEDYNKVEEFFKVYNVFYEEFAKEYEDLSQNNDCKDLENILSNKESDELSKKNFEYIKQILQNETMYNLNAVELFEILDDYEEKERQKVVPFMSKKLQKEYKQINKE